MPLATRRSYAGAAPACTLSSDIAAGATSFSITGTTTNWPSTATGPFYMVIDPGLSTEEKVLVGARTSGSLSSVTRGVDGTTAASHVTGATCYPVFTAVDANDANLLASRLSAKGDLISSDGTDPTKVAVGSNNTRLVADSAQTSGMKWVADTQNTVIDAKGDLLVGSAADTVARLAVGTDGHALVADSVATNGLGYSPMTGWRNFVINGDFSINQRALTSSGTTTSGVFGFDRWRFNYSGGTATYSSQAFTVGNPITGQEPANFARVVTASQSAAGDLCIFNTQIESARTFAGQQVTLSFWAKAGSGTPKVAVELIQSFGTGGSPSADVNTYVSQVTLSTSWTRFTITTTVPSISGKTFGSNGNDFLGIWLWTSAGSTHNARTGSLGIQNATIDFWGVQLEAGPTATPFERRPRQVELALCQRYYQIINGGGAMAGAVRNTTGAYCACSFPVEMRSGPTVTLLSGGGAVVMPADVGYTITAIGTFLGSTRSIRVYTEIGTASLVAGYGIIIQCGTSASDGFSLASELV